MWAGTRYVCTCSAPMEAKFLCKHTLDYIEGCRDTALFVASESSVGQIKAVDFPFTGQSTMTVSVETVRHPSITGEYAHLVTAHTAGAAIDIEVYLGRGEGLVRFFRTAREVVRSWSEYTVTYDALVRRKISGLCRNVKHGGLQNQLLSRTIRRLAAYRLGEFRPEEDPFHSWSADVLSPIWDEVALTEAYALRLANRCHACLEATLDPHDVPADLIPKV